MDTTTAEATAGPTFPAGDLWKEQPAIIFVVRRPGCPLCREHALDLSNKHPEFAAKGVRLVGVVHEKLGVEEFASGFFKNGEIYFDEEKAFFNGENFSLTALKRPRDIVTFIHKIFSHISATLFPYMPPNVACRRCHRQGF